MRVLVYGMNGTSLGGIEKFLVNSSKNFKSLKFDYIIEGENCIYEKDIQELDGKIFYIPHKKQNPIRSLISFYKVLKKNNYEIIYFNLPSLYYSFPIFLAKIAKYKIIVHSHNGDMPNIIIYKILHIINQKIVIRIADLLLSCSDVASEYMFGCSNVDIIKNGIEINKFKFNANTRNTFRKQYNIEDNYVIGWVGRIAYQKNPLILIDIFAYFFKKHANSKLIMIGDGEMKDIVLEKIRYYGIEKNVHLIGNVDNVNDWMQAMDVFVLPSLYEGLPIVLVEAQTSGLKCVVSDSITKMANSTGYVTYLKLPEDENDKKNIDKWVSSLSLPNFERGSSYLKIIDDGYNIQDSALELEEKIRKLVI